MKDYGNEHVQLTYKICSILGRSSWVHLVMLSLNDFILYWQTAIHRSFALADNLGEVSAKAQVIRFLIMFVVFCFASKFM